MSELVLIGLVVSACCLIAMLFAASVMVVTILASGRAKLNLVLRVVMLRDLDRVAKRYRVGVSSTIEPVTDDAPEYDWSPERRELQGLINVISDLGGFTFGLVPNQEAAARLGMDDAMLKDRLQILITHVGTYSRGHDQRLHRMIITDEARGEIKRLNL